MLLLPTATMLAPSTEVCAVLLVGSHYTATFHEVEGFFSLHNSFLSLCSRHRGFSERVHLWRRQACTQGETSSSPTRQLKESALDTVENVKTK